MKHIIKFLLSILLIVTFCIVKSYSYDYTSVTPQPCEQDANHPWNGPYSYRICNKDLSLRLQCDINCCWTFVYYERFTGTNNNEYEINVTAVFHDGGTDCDQCDLPAFTNAFLKLININNENIVNFKQKVMSTSRTPDIGFDTWIYTYSTAKCFDSNGLQCGEIRCCRYRTNIKFSPDQLHPNRVEGLEYSNNWTPTIIPACPPQCNPICFQINYGDNPDICNTDCETGQLIRIMNQEISKPGCPGCKITFNYTYRSNEDCDSPWQDYKLEMPISTTPECDNCFPFGTSELKDLIYDWLLTQSSDLPKPQYPDCTEFFRITSPPCITGWGRVMTECLNSTSCCKSRYRLCWDGTYTLLETSNNSVPCTTPCYAFCNVFPYIIQPTNINYSDDQLKELIILHPNPSQGEFEIQFNSNSSLNINLRITSILGEIIVNDNLSLSPGNYMKKYDFKSKPNGTYLYSIIYKDKILKNSSFIINK